LLYVDPSIKEEEARKIEREKPQGKGIDEFYSGAAPRGTEITILDLSEKDISRYELWLRVYRREGLKGVQSRDQPNDRITSYPSDIRWIYSIRSFESSQKAPLLENLRAHYQGLITAVYITCRALIVEMLEEACVL
jgi:hypothetical protein